MQTVGGSLVAGGGRLQTAKTHSAETNEFRGYW